MSALQQRVPAFDVTWINARAPLVLAPALLLLSPFVSFLRYHGYDLWRAEVWLAAGLIAGLGLCFGTIAALRPAIWGTVVFLVLAAVLYDFQSSTFDLRTALVAYGRDVTAGVIVLAIALCAATAVWLVRRYLGVIAICVSGVIFLSALLLPGERLSVGTRIDQARGNSADIPPVILLVIDEQIGVEGVPTDIPDGRQLRDDLKRFYQTFDFARNGGAFSHSSETRLSLAALLNAQSAMDGRTEELFKSGKYHISPNAWFDALGNAGYRIRVYQTNWLIFCFNDHPAIEYCRTFPANSVKSLDGTGLSALTKLRLILNSFLDNSSLFSVFRRLTHVPTIKLGPLAVPAVLDRIAADLKGRPRGTAVFAHLLVPHYPYIFDENCRPKANPADWINRFDLQVIVPNRINSPRSRALRYEAYFRQVRCAHALLGGFFGKLIEADLFEDATIIVLGDHGSRIALMNPIEGLVDQLSDRDIIDHFSSLFAIKRPGRAASYEPGARSIQGLFAEEILGQRLPGESSEVVLRRTSKRAKGPYRRRAMPSFSD